MIPDGCGMRGTVLDDPPRPTDVIWTFQRNAHVAFKPSGGRVVPILTDPWAALS
jgi:hypothetical protein